MHGSPAPMGIRLGVCGCPDAKRMSPCTATFGWSTSCLRSPPIPRRKQTSGRSEMAFFWTLKSIPELANLPARDRRVYWRRAYRRTWRHWRTWAGLLACALCAGLGSRLGASVDHATVGAMIGGGIGGFVFGQVTVRVARSHYKNVLLGSESYAIEQQARSSSSATRRYSQSIKQFLIERPPASDGSFRCGLT
ncbi:hypothetical protein J2793_006956 [Paraburkholderia caledonica]|uniref:Glycine zipper 2TM domain-containing protein n=1 Tax=Paraburkholderia caledonica TaxID=134536 RepID=A0AB73IND3_9BURK|nr:hypothetical protein [Paraburkholderia caledonica]